MLATEARVDRLRTRPRDEAVNVAAPRARRAPRSRTAHRWRANRCACWRRSAAPVPASMSSRAPPEPARPTCSMPPAKLGSLRISRDRLRTGGPRCGRLEDGAGIPSMTLDRLLRHLDRSPDDGALDQPHGRGRRRGVHGRHPQTRPTPRPRPHRRRQGRARRATTTSSPKSTPAAPSSASPPGLTHRN